MNSQLQQAWLDPDNLIYFIDQLKEAGYNIGVSQYIAAQDLVLALITEGVNLDQPQRFKNMLGSLLCSSPQEQEDFHLRFDRWVEEMGVIVPLPDNKLKEIEKARKLEHELIQVRKQSKRWKRIWLFISGVVIVSIIGVTITYFSSAPIKKVPAASNPPATTEPSQVVVEPLTPIEWQTVLIALLVILVTFLIWRWWWHRRAKSFLKRNATKDKPKLQEISIADNDKDLFPNLLYLKIAQQFRKRIKFPSTEIDVEKSLVKTLENGGWYTPIYEMRQIPPEYLFLVDRASYGDHQAKFITEMIDRLINNGVFISSYYFDNDPRICYPMTGEITSCKLTELAAKYRKHRLIVFSEAERLFSPVTGELEPWVEIFAQWQESAVLTPKPMENWGYEELELAEQFMILPATDEGLANFINNLEIESSSITLTSKNRPPIPYSLQERPLYWIDREAPEDYLIAETIPTLKQYLGEDGYYWLSACAIFPELHWNLTLYLGNTLKSSKEKDKTLLQTCNLSNLSRLPWFRYGYIPDWLRLLLIADLSLEQDQNIRAKLNQLLVTAVSGSVSGIQLEIAEKHSNSVSKITKPLLKLFTDQSSEDSPLRDYIFQNFIAAKHENLAVKLPKNWRKIIINQHKLKPSLKLWFSLLTSDFLVSIIISIFIFISVFIVSLVFNVDNSTLLNFIQTIFFAFLIIKSLIKSNLQIFFLKVYTFKFNLRLKIFWIISSFIFADNISLVFWASLFSEINNFPDFLNSNFQLSYIPYALLLGIIISIPSELIRRGFSIKIKKSEKILYLISARCLDITIIFCMMMVANDNFLTGFLLIIGIPSELFYFTALVWILRQPVQEQKEYKSCSSLNKWIIPIFFILTLIAGVFYQVLQNRINESDNEITRPDIPQSQE